MAALVTLGLIGLSFKALAVVPVVGSYSSSQWLRCEADECPVKLSVCLEVSQDRSSVTGSLTLVAFYDYDAESETSQSQAFITGQECTSRLGWGKFCLQGIRLNFKDDPFGQFGIANHPLRSRIKLANGDFQWADDCVVDVSGRFTSPDTIQGEITRQGKKWLTWEGRPTRMNPPPIDAEEAARKAIAQYDNNHDGQISDAELNNCPALKVALARIDTLGKGAITAENISNRIKQWQKSKIAGMTLCCRVFRNHEPLPRAEVRLVPEKFLGENMPIFTGKTSRKGTTQLHRLSADQDQSHLHVIPPGFYRVEIVKAGENIPPKYNTETVFGVEVAIDSEEAKKGLPIGEGIPFDLKY